MGVKKRKFKKANNLGELAKIVEKLAKANYKHYAALQEARRQLYNASDFYSGEAEEKLLQFAFEILEQKDRDKTRGRD